MLADLPISGLNQAAPCGWRKGEREWVRGWEKNGEREWEEEGEDNE